MHGYHKVRLVTPFSQNNETSKWIRRSQGRDVIITDA